MSTQIPITIDDMDTCRMIARLAIFLGEGDANHKDAANFLVKMLPGRIGNASGPKTEGLW